MSVRPPASRGRTAIGSLTHRPAAQRSNGEMGRTDMSVSAAIAGRVGVSRPRDQRSAKSDLARGAQGGRLRVRDAAVVASSRSRREEARRARSHYRPADRGRSRACGGELWTVGGSEDGIAARACCRPRDRALMTLRGYSALRRARRSLALLNRALVEPSRRGETFMPRTAGSSGRTSSCGWFRSRSRRGSSWSTNARRAEFGEIVTQAGDDLAALVDESLDS